MSTFFTTTKAAKIRPESVAKEIKLGKRKEKIAAGKLENYSYDKADFKFITPLPIDAKISWRAMAIKFDVLNQEGIRPCNAGQVLLEAAKALGVKTDQFDTNVSVSGRDYMQRIRRNQKGQTLTPGQGSIHSDSSAWPTRHINREIERRHNNRVVRGSCRSD